MEKVSNRCSKVTRIAPSRLYHLQEIVKNLRRVNYHPRVHQIPISFPFFIERVGDCVEPAVGVNIGYLLREGYRPGDETTRVSNVCYAAYCVLDFVLRGLCETSVV